MFKNTTFLELEKPTPVIKFLLQIVTLLNPTYDNGERVELPKCCVVKH